MIKHIFWDYNGILFKSFNENIKVYPDIYEFCVAFKNSGGSNYIITNRDCSIFRILNDNDMKDLFIEVITKEDNFKRRPHSDSFRYLAKKYDINPSEVLIIGSTNIELLFAINCSVKSCLYNIIKQDIMFTPDFIVDSVPGLYKIVGLK